MSSELREVHHREELSDQQKVFVEEYLRNGFIALKAARAAGYTSSASPWLLMKHPTVRAAIDERIKNMVMSADEVLHRLSEQARGEYGQYIMPDGEIDIERLVADGKGHLIKSIRDAKYGKSYQFESSVEALKLLARYYSLVGADVHVEDNRQINFNTIEVRLSEPEQPKAIPEVIDGEIE